MIRFYQIFDPDSEYQREKLNASLDIFKKYYNYYEDYAEKIPQKIKQQAELGYKVGMIIAESLKDGVVGFALYNHFWDVQLSYLEFIVTRRDIRGRGLGGALYESLRETLFYHGSKGLFLEARPDVSKLVRQKEELKQNKIRMKFYESYDVRPIQGILYDIPPFGKWVPPFLLYDHLGRNRPLKASDCKKIVKKILVERYGVSPTDRYLKKMIKSIKKENISTRPFKYIKKVEKIFPSVKKSLFNPLKVVYNEKHKIHHIKEIGYVERPVRVQTILKAIEDLPFIEFKSPRVFSENYIKEVHAKYYVNYIKNVCKSLKENEVIYPYVFPIRYPDRKPRDRGIRAGYYCIDTFTPLTGNVYPAARDAVNCALTGAELIMKKGEHIVYSICRPPGHHAEKDSYGGFCYFNNSAIAANYLSKKGKVAILDIDFHHGNGTQNIFYNSKKVLFVSIHGTPYTEYPYFSGFSEEKGRGRGYGYNYNFPLDEKVKDEKYLKILKKALRTIRRFSPKFLVVSTGFDISKDDPTGSWMITSEGFREIGKALSTFSIPILIVQEGGYTTRALGKNVRNFLAGICSKYF
ncbi:MAG: histone deacetylase family protein [Acidobacteriota bacterium]